MDSTAAVFLSCLLLLCAQAQPANRSSKCKCVNSYVSKVRAQLIQAEPVVYEPSSFCAKTEIIVMIANKEKCVNPQSPLGKLILKRKQQRQVTKAAVSPTPASGRTDAWRSTTRRRHTTSRL